TSVSLKIAGRFRIVSWAPAATWKLATGPATVGAELRTMVRAVIRWPFAAVLARTVNPFNPGFKATFAKLNAPWPSAVVVATVVSARNRVTFAPAAVWPVRVTEDISVRRSPGVPVSEAGARVNDTGGPGVWSVNVNVAGCDALPAASWAT